MVSLSSQALAKPQVSPLTLPSSPSLGWARTWATRKPSTAVFNIRNCVPHNVKRCGVRTLAKGSPAHGHQTQRGQGPLRGAPRSSPFTPACNCLKLSPHGSSRAKHAREKRSFSFCHPLKGMYCAESWGKRTNLDAYGPIKRSLKSVVDLKENTARGPKLRDSHSAVGWDLGINSIGSTTDGSNVQTECRMNRQHPSRAGGTWGSGTYTEHLLPVPGRGPWAHPVCLMSTSYHATTLPSSYSAWVFLPIHCVTLARLSQGDTTPASSLTFPCSQPSPPHSQTPQDSPAVARPLRASAYRGPSSAFPHQRTIAHFLQCDCYSTSRYYLFVLNILFWNKILNSIKNSSESS